MKKIIKYLSLFLLISNVISAQYVDIFSNYSSESYFPYYDIWNVEIHTDIPYEQYYFVKVELRNDQQNLLMISRTKAFLFSSAKSPYNIIYHRNENGNYEYEWIDPAFYKSIQQTGGFLPPGNYEINYKLLATTEGCNWAGKVLFNKNFYLNINLFNLIDLVNPPNKDTLTTNYPTFVWLPLSPPSAGNITYTIKLVEVKEGLTPEESINTNLPVYENQNLSTTSHIYPISARILEHSRQYAWMVTAYINSKLAAYSPVYSFYLLLDKTTPPKPQSDPFYIELTPYSTPQTIELHNDYLYISYILRENKSGKLNYKIINSKTRKELINEELQPLIIGQGKNLYQIDISRLPDKTLYELIIKATDNTDIRTLYFYLKK